MKKILLFASALAGLVLAGSCQRENLEPQQTGQQVTFTIEAPAAMQTKAIADGQNVDQLVYEVWLTPTLGDLENGAQKLYQATAEMVSDGTINKAELTLDLVNDQKFTVLFWAQVAHTYDTDELTAVGYKDLDALKANDESLAAFYGVAYVDDCRNVKIDGSSASPEVILKRPFAQLNLCTLNTSTAYKVDMLESEVIVENVPTVFNVVNGVEDVNSYAKVTFDMAAVPADPKTITVNNKTYHYAGMNYMFAGDNITLEYNIKTALNGQSEAVVNNKISSVPLKENYRTNIVGNLLTSQTDFEIIVDAAFEGNDLAPDPIYLAAANGGEVTLTEDVVLDEPLEINADMTLDLNGKTITGVMTVSKGTDVTIENGKITNTNNQVSGITTNGNLTLNDVEIVSARHAVRVESGKVVINGGTYKVAPVSNSTLHALNVGDDNTEAEVIIKGGTFTGPKGTMADSGSAVNVRSGSKVTIEGGDFSGGKNKTLACGGTLTVKGGSFDQTPAAFLAEGYKVMTKDGKFYVVSEETDGIVSDNADLQNALKDAVANGETELVIDAEGASLNLNYGFSTSTVPAGSTVTIRNANIEGRSKNNYANGTIIFEDCTFSNPTGAYSIHFDGGEGSLIFKNCDLFGWNSFAGSLESVSFENCTLTGNGIYALIRSYTDLTLKNCTIDASNANHTDAYSEGVEAVSGATLTMENIEYVVYDEKSLEFALENAAVNTIYLTPREDAYIADIYNVTAARESLTIIGSEGTKFGHTATTGGQLRLDLFERFTISNCEIIQRSGVKTWGHLVFSASGKKNGVYTIKNCTFNSNGNQGIYINETTSGAVYNIENCTFNGDFGSADGAVTIQNNRGAAFTVNVNGCTFNTDSKEICYLYDDPAFTLNTDSTVAPVCLNR